MDILHEIPQDELAEIAEISKRCHELHAVAPVMATVELEVKDLKTGEVLSRYADLSRSWTRNYYNVMVSQMFSCAAGVMGSTFGAGLLTTKDTAASLHADATHTNYLARNLYLYVNESGLDYGWRADVTNNTRGIVIGINTGAAAESLEDYALNTLITNGSTAGKMNYQAMAAPTVSWLGTPDFKFKSIGTRQFLNTGGGSIDVKEVGIYMEVFGSLSCVVRDVLGATVTCPDPSQVTATYTLYSPSLGA